MHDARTQRITGLEAFAVVIFIVVSCTGTMSSQVEHEEGGNVQVLPACDPDGVAPCPSDWFICSDDDALGKRCEGQEPSTPEGDGWVCHESEGMRICEGSRIPEDSGEWICEQSGDDVICIAPGYVPSIDGDGVWSCDYEGEFWVCVQSEGGRNQSEDETSSDTPDDQGDEWSVGGSSSEDSEDGDTDWWEDLWEDWFDGFDDDDSDMDSSDDWSPDDWHNSLPDHEGYGDVDDFESGCVCVPGAWRYCDEPNFCSWGIQYCDEDSLSWGRCTETAKPMECDDGWYDEDCCVENGYCCQDESTNASIGNCDDIIVCAADSE